MKNYKIQVTSDCNNVGSLVNALAHCAADAGGWDEIEVEFYGNFEFPELFWDVCDRVSDVVNEGALTYNLTHN